MTRHGTDDEKKVKLDKPCLSVFLLFFSSLPFTLPVAVSNQSVFDKARSPGAIRAVRDNRKCRGKIWPQLETLAETPHTGHPEWQCSRLTAA